MSFNLVRIKKKSFCRRVKNGPKVKHFIIITQDVSLWIDGQLT